ncbi:MAG TPA: DinB family protein [Terriglobales bacterium]|nr:DinB family protein [Terriglobales bacterium]
MNPYAAHLGSRDPMQVIAATPSELARSLAAMDAARQDQPRAPGKWSPRQLTCHLADCEIVFAYRLRQGLAEKHHVVQPFDQELWAPAYAPVPSGYTAAAALAVFSAVRAWNLAFLRGLSPADLAKRLTHPERGEMPLREIVETMAGHDLNHLAQIG